MTQTHDLIHQVTVELMRPGSLSGQLLSKLTAYLAVFDDSHAETIHLPFDHWDLLHLLRGLSNSHAPEDRESALRVMGQRVREFMDKLSLLPGELRNQTDGRRLLHIRLALSGHELALIPYEAGHGPSPPFSESEPLLAHASRQVVITRELRQSSAMPLDWIRPHRVLLIGAAPEPYMPVPLRAQSLSLYQALKPFEYQISQHDSAGRPAASMLTILPNATLDKIRQVCSQATPPYTHVVLLAHGAPLQEHGMERYGVALHNDRGGLDCVSSQRLRDALCPVHSDGRGVFPPTMLVMLMCHGGAQGDVILPVGSVAHELHAAGIPWVLASQFPLSMEGSVTISDRLFPSLFLGDDPRLVLHSVRQSLRARGGHHDWASLVAYAAIPSDFARQVQLSRRRAADLACSVLFNVIDNETQCSMQSRSAGPVPGGISIEKRAEYEQLVDGYFGRIRDTQPSADTPETAADRAEVFGMLGGIERNRAFLLDTPALGSSPVRDLRKLRQRLDRARNFYAAARTLWTEYSWNTVHYLSLTALLGEKIPLAVWTSAFQVAAEQKQSADHLTRCWGRLALCELHLLALSLPPMQRRTLAALADGKGRFFHAQQAKALFQTLRNHAEQDGDIHRKVSRQLRRYQLATEWKLWNPPPDCLKLLRELLRQLDTVRPERE